MIPSRAQRDPGLKNIFGKIEQIFNQIRFTDDLNTKMNWIKETCKEIPSELVFELSQVYANKRF